MEIFRARFEKNTWGQVLRGFAAFVRFIDLYLEKRNGKPIPVDVYLYCKFMKWYFRTTGNAGGTARRYISGINSVLQWLGYGLNLHNYNSEPLVRTAKGIDNIRGKYKIGKKRVLRRALIDGMLDQMLAQLDDNDPFQYTMKGTIAFEKQTGFRCHNVIMTAHGGNVCIRHLTWFPNIDTPSSLIVRLPYSKTRGRYAPEYETRTIKCRCHEGVCAVHIVADLIRDRLHKPYEAVFVMPNGAPVTYTTLKKVLRALSELFHLNYQFYTSHALRYGQATDLHRKGWSIARIMKWMGWESRKSAMKYIRNNNEDFVKFGIEA